MSYSLGFVNVVAKGIQFAVRGADLVIEVDKLIENQNFNELKGASVTTRTALLFLGIAEIALAIANRSSSSTAITLKSIESLVHVINVPVQMSEAAIVLANPSATTMDKVKIVEKKIIGSLIGLIRSTSELEYSSQVRYRDLPPEEQEKLQFPIYKCAGEDCEIVGYKPFNKEECLQTISNLQACIPIMNSIETSVEIGIGSNIVGITKPAFNLLVARVTAIAQNAPAPIPSLQTSPALVGAATRRGVGHGVAAMGGGRVGFNFDNDGDFDRAVTNSLNSSMIPQLVVRAIPQEEDLGEQIDLKRYKFIPSELHEDEVFKQFICSITRVPIRYVVGDPTSLGSPIYYERNAIHGWLRGQNVSPLTRKPLSISILKPCVAIQALINARLDTYTERIREEIRSNGLLSLNQESVNAAILQDQMS